MGIPSLAFCSARSIDKVCHALRAKVTDLDELEDTSATLERHLQVCVWLVVVVVRLSAHPNAVDVNVTSTSSMSSCH